MTTVVNFRVAPYDVYREGALAAEIVWLDQPLLSFRLFDARILQLVSATIGPNVTHPEETKAGASDRWLALRASRAIARCRFLPRHVGGLNG